MPAEMPDLGDSALTFTVELTEPEINTIHAMFGFCRGASLEQLPTATLAQKFFKAYILQWWNHYGKVAAQLSNKLEKLEEEKTNES